MMEPNFLLFFLLGLSTFVFGQRGFDDVKIVEHKINDKLYMLEGAGGNIGLLIGDDGALIIDAQFAELSEKIKSSVANITKDKINYLINTHWHGDHVGGNENFGKDGALIIAHENVLKRMSTDQVRPFRKTTPAAPEEARPQVTYSEEMKVHFNDETLHLLHVHNAHTDGDGFVYFSESNVLHMGDCFFKDRFPFIDLDSGGSPDGALKAISIAMMLCDSETIIIPGHGSLAKKEDLLNYYQMLNTITDRVKSSIKEGHSEAEALEANLTEGYETWGTGFINAEKLIKTLYKSYIESD